jgi:DNA-binding CsgD family transcriptional regulator
MGAPEDLRIARLGPGMVVVSWAQREEAPPLTTAESEVLAMAVAGLSNAAIAQRRSCSVRTVANLLARAYRKLGVGSRSAAAAKLALDLERTAP